MARIAGEGKVRQRNPNDKSKGFIWQGTITLWNGEKKRVAATGDTEEEVVEKKRIILAEEVQGKAIAKSSLTVEQWGRLWLDNYKKINLEPNTWHTYDAAFKNHINPTIGSIPLQKLTTNDIQQMIKKLTKTMIPSTIKNIIAYLTSCIKQALKLGYVNRNVCDDVTMPKIAKSKKKRILSADDLKKLIDLAYKDYINPLSKFNKTYYPALMLAIETGVRRSELLGLKWANVNLEDNIILIKDTVVPLAGKVYTKDEPKNESSIRYLPISPYVADLINKIERKCEYVFYTRKNKPIRPSMWNKRFATWCEKLGVKFSPHDLRHTFITDMINSGESITNLQSFTGHATPIILLKDYAHIIPEEKLNAAKRKHDRMKQFQLQQETQLQQNCNKTKKTGLA